jgi:N6-L-threonylcarbamoyladenine synthase
MKVLGIETSCDETAVAIVDGSSKKILSNIIYSQIDLHQKYGGVVPEIAARSHIDVLDKIILSALKKAKLNFSDLDCISATAGPGLIGSVIVGLTTAKTLASVLKKPFIAVNHLEAHGLVARLTSDIKFPYLLLLFSGGHSQILLAKGVNDYEKISDTIDDAIGESFDKVAQLLNLGYPGGPQIEKFAINGDEKKFKFPRPLIDKFDKNNQFNFSLSGLKTAVRREVEGAQNLSKSDVCASFQRTVSDIILNRLQNIFDQHKSLKTVDLQGLVIGGGVSANRYIFEKISNFSKKIGLETITAPLELCTDNGVMIAWAGIERLKLGLVDSLDFKPRARWDLY